MNAKARELGLTGTHYREPARARRAGPRLDRPRRRLCSCATRSATRSSAAGRRGRRATLSDGRVVESTDNLLGACRLVGGKTGHTADAGWSQVARRAGRRRRDHRRRARLRRARRSANADLAALLRLGLAQLPAVEGRRPGRTYYALAGRAGAARRCGSSRRERSSARPRRPAARRARRRARPLRAARRARASASGGAGRRGRLRLVARSPLVAATSRGLGTRGQGVVVRPPHRPPSRRARLVRPRPGGSLDDHHRHAERRARPLAHRPELPARPAPSRERRPHARGRQGDQRRARAQAARRPGRRDRARGRPHRHAHRRGADRGGDPQRLRPHRRRVAHVDRSSSTRPRAPRRRSTSGARRSPRTSSRCCSTSCATSPAAPTTVVFAGSLPRGVDDGFYADAVRELTRRGVRVVLDTEGEPLRLGLEAEPWLVSPNQHEAEQLVGQELNDEEDFLMALDTIAELGARNVHITLESGCFALVREERQVRRYRVDAPRLEPVSVVGAGDAFLAQLARRACSTSGLGRGGAAPRGRGRRRVGARGRRGPLRSRGGARGSLPRSRSTSCQPVVVTPAAAEARPSRDGLVESTDHLEFELDREDKFAQGRPRPSTTCCSCRPSRRCSRTTSRRRRG